MLPSKKIFEGSFSNGMNPNQIHRTPKALKRTLAAKTPLACLIDLTETKCYSPSHVWRFVSPMDCGRRDRLPTPVFLGFPCGSAGKESACNVGDLGSIPALGRSPGEGKGYPLQYSGLENSNNCVVHGVSKSRTQLITFTLTCSRGSSQPRDRTWVSCIAGRFFTVWAIREVQQRPRHTKWEKAFGIFLEVR